jgi:hypothetical protein
MSALLLAPLLARDAAKPISTLKCCSTVKNTFGRLKHVREIIGEADIDGDSRISFKEFVAIMSKPSELRSVVTK